MSVHTTTWVWKHSTASGSAFVVLLALADHAHPDGTHAYPSVAELARMARVSERTVQRCLQELADLGEVTVISQASRYKPTEYTINQGCQIVTPRRG